MADHTARLRFGNYIRSWSVTAEDADTLYSLFGTPESLLGYLRGFGFIIADTDVADRIPMYVPKRGSREQHLVFPYACLAEVAPGVPSPKLSRLEQYIDLFSANIPTPASFKKLERRNVDPDYAGALWARGVRITAILRLWRDGVPLEFASELGRDA